MITDGDRKIMKIVAKHASISSSVANIIEDCNADVDQAEEWAMEAMSNLISNAPATIQDDFELCCAHFLLREVLIDSVNNNSTAMILTTQLELLKLTDRG